MPVSTGAYKDNETQIYTFLVTTAGLNTAAACGILANIQWESGFNHTIEGDMQNGVYTSYGLCQWHAGRKTRLIQYCKNNGLSHATVTGQLRYLLYELRNGYTGVWNTLSTVPNNAIGVAEAARKWCIDFEVPADRYNQATIRATTAVNNFWPYYSGNPELSNVILNLGQRIVQIAKQQVGKPYVSGGNGPDSFDCSGLVFYSYNQAGYTLSDQTADSYYRSSLSAGAKNILPSNTCAGDLLFYENDENTGNGLDHVAIADGNGGRIHAKGRAYGVVEETSLGEPTYILRLLADSETSQGFIPDILLAGIGGGDTGITNYASLVSNDIYVDTIAKNLSRVQSVGYDFGYLIDMVDDKEFKFYIPEFSESAGAEWNTVDLIGRSVSILAYNHTSSRKITVSLDLYAGVGVYKGITDDAVGKLHADANFIKSLEYPDYTNPIARPPHPVHLILGAAINMIGVVSGVTIDHMKPLDASNRSMYLKVSFTVSQTAVNPPSFEDIRNNEYAIVGTDDPSSLIEDNGQDTNAPTYTE